MGKKIFFWVLGAIIIYCWGHVIGYDKGRADAQKPSIAANISFMQGMGAWQE